MSTPHPSRFLHTPGIGETTYLVSDTVAGRHLQRITPEESTWITTQRMLARAVVPLALAAMVALGFTIGDQAVAPRIAGHPLLGDGGYWITIACAMSGMAASVLSTLGHWRQRHMLSFYSGLAQPTTFTRDELAELPDTVRGMDTLVVLSRAADTGQLGAVYSELYNPGGPNHPAVEAALAELTRP